MKYENEIWVYLMSLAWNHQKTLDEMRYTKVILWYLNLQYEIYGFLIKLKFHFEVKYKCWGLGIFLALPYFILLRSLNVEGYA